MLGLSNMRTPTLIKIRHAIKIKNKKLERNGLADSHVDTRY